MTEMTPEELVAYEGPDRVVHFTDYLLSSTKQSKTKGFRSGFSLFEEKMGGIETGEVIVISGHRKEGKTLFAESWLRSMTKVNAEAKPLILSYEVNPDKLLAKYVKEETTPIYLPMKLETMNFDWLLNRCKEAKYKYNCRIVLIDHLHFMIDMSAQQNMSLNIGGFMRSLKHRIAINLNLAVILIAHQGQPREGKEASADTLRDSSFVSQESDVTIIVSRRENFNSADLKEYETRYGYEMAQSLTPDPFSSPEDKFSANLSVVRIDCHRRLGTYKWKKLFKKQGDWMEEI